MTRTEAIQKLTEENYHAAANQRYEVVPLGPEDGWGVARCYFAIYGGAYPIDTGYLPAKLLEENARGNIYSAIARTASGDVVAYGALYRSSSPNPKLYELGQYVILPEYRDGRSVIRITRLLLDQIAPEAGIEAHFGETVCNHVASQKLGRVLKDHETAIEIGLMPAEAYPREDFPNDRVSTLLQFGVTKDHHQVAYLPAIYRRWLETLLGNCRLDRTIMAADGSPAQAQTAIDRKYFDFAKVLRTNVLSVGVDFASMVRESERQYVAQGARVLQYFLNLGEPSVDTAVHALRAYGYCFGGLLPAWFGADGLLMQKVLDMPDFRSIKLFSDRARQILDFVQADLASLGCG